MKKTNYIVSAKTMQVATLKQAGMLKQYGIDKPSDFEIAQLSKFGLTDYLKGVVVTGTGIVFCNYELVLIAKSEGIKEIEVTVIENLADDEIPQVICATNVRKRLTKKSLADLIVDYRDYLTKNETGKVWADEVPGNSIDAKIGTIVGYSYGMINGYLSIYNNHPEFLGMIDAGEMSYTGALQIIKEENQPTCATGNGTGNPTTPVVPKAPKHNYAGERNMVPCEAIGSIQIRYEDGRTIDLIMAGSNAIGQLFDRAIEPIYTSKKEVFEGGAEYHRLDFKTNKKACFIELVIKKAA